ncbi:hypothetical protein LOTGIDRAFT_152765 [Lottia gigantea]|uniref:G-protein coupled receptors family 1 profile domain-containing protein n=1 Tax=Lottia gigantea TaxID=225164 RepID=V4AKN3_LOTGI|nr:hypothetical protein LOTGIDRAFT_152765 [Lottia gigantea]ESO97677.1 hypothetical protein LOTGIDRAFT_152765 [Lottia gigantea]
MSKTKQPQISLHKDEPIAWACTIDKIENVSEGLVSHQTMHSTKQPISNTEKNFEASSMVNNTNTLTEKQCNQLKELLTEYQDIFMEPGKRLGYSEKRFHTIDTGDSRPISVPWSIKIMGICNMTNFTSDVHTSCNVSRLIDDTWGTSALSHWEDFVVGTYIAFIVCTSILMNSLILFVLYQHRSRLMFTDYFIVSLAITDLGSPLFAYPMACTSSYSHKWLYKDIVCFTLNINIEALSHGHAVNYRCV